ncbi:MAG: hypothetical protein M9941_13115 [Anaerolineae bacterium]|nr:hypothetical protein [Anaerolineae bacterium]MCO5198677.1 hypothetical protein [Anaerolineae bacterium]
MKIGRPSKLTIGALLIGGVFLLQAILLYYPKAPTWDAAFYYSYARSLVFDGDINLVNDIVLAYPTGGEHFTSKQFHTDLTTTGHLQNTFALGAALFWVPWLALARSAELFLVDPGSLTGYEVPFITGAALISALLVLIAFLLLYRRLTAYFNWSSAIIGVLTLMFTTPLLHYQFHNGFYSHAASAFIVTLCFLWWWRSYDKPMQPRAALVMGGLLGFSMLVRWQHAIYVVLPGLSVLWWWWRQPGAEKRQALRPAAVSLLLTAGSLLLVFSIQLVLWKVYFNSWLTIPQGDFYVDYRPLWLLPTLFSPFRGLLPWMPVALPALIGLLLLARKNPYLVVPLFVVLLLALYVNASTRDWFGGGGYGPRRFTSELPIWALGYTALLAALAPRLRVWVGGLLAALLIVHQWILLAFGIPEELGGRVTSMAPTYTWEETTWTEFGRSLLAHIPDLPTIIVQGESPLWKWQHNIPTLRTELLVWVIVTVLVALCCGVIIRLWRVDTGSEPDGSG